MALKRQIIQHQYYQHFAKRLLILDRQITPSKREQGSLTKAMKKHHATIPKTTSTAITFQEIQRDETESKQTDPSKTTNTTVHEKTTTTLHDLHRTKETITTSILKTTDKYIQKNPATTDTTITEVANPDNDQVENLSSKPSAITHQCYSNDENELTTIASPCNSDIISDNANVQPTPIHISDADSKETDIALTTELQDNIKIDIPQVIHTPPRCTTILNNSPVMSSTMMTDAT